MSNPTDIVPPAGLSPFAYGVTVPVRRLSSLGTVSGAAELPPGTGIISGTITFNGSPGNGAICSLVTDPTNELVRQATANSLGEYVFTNIPPGRYQVLAYDPNLQYRSKVAHTVVS